MLVLTAFTVKFSVAIESQPTELVSVSFIDPAAVNILPFQVYGNDDGQMLVFVVLVTTELTVKFNVATESQPTEFANVSVKVPAVVNVLPFQVYGNDDGQILVFVVLVLTALVVKISVATESQPTEFVSVSTKVPAVLNVLPFQVYG